MVDASVVMVVAICGSVCRTISRTLERQLEWKSSGNQRRVCWCLAVDGRDGVDGAVVVAVEPRHLLPRLIREQHVETAGGLALVDQHMSDLEAPQEVERLVL